MDRRSFLGTVIGTVISTQLPFVAKAVTLPRKYPAKLEFIRQFVRIFDLTEQQLCKFKMYAVTDKDERFYVPAKLILRQEETPKVRFEAGDLVVSRSVTIKACGIFTDENKFLRENAFSFPVHMVNGETLKFTHDIMMG
jgi:hypothetical protein